MPVRWRAGLVQIMYGRLFLFVVRVASDMDRSSQDANEGAEAFLSEFANQAPFVHHGVW